MGAERPLVGGKSNPLEKMGGKGLCRRPRRMRDGAYALASEEIRGLWAEGHERDGKTAQAPGPRAGDGTQGTPGGRAQDYDRGGVDGKPENPRRSLHHPIDGKVKDALPVPPKGLSEFGPGAVGAGVDDA